MNVINNSVHAPDRVAVLGDQVHYNDLANDDSNSLTACMYAVVVDVAPYWELGGIVGRSEGERLRREVLRPGWVELAVMGRGNTRYVRAHELDPDAPFAFHFPENCPAIPRAAPVPVSGSLFDLPPHDEQSVDEDLPLFNRTTESDRTAVHAFVISGTATADYATVTGIVEASGMSKTTVRRRIRDLVDLGHVAPIAHPICPRRYLAIATQKGSNT